MAASDFLGNLKFFRRVFFMSHYLEKQPLEVFCKKWCSYKFHKIDRKTPVPAQVAHDVVTTLGLGCILVATSDNVVTTLSQRCVSDVVTSTKN